ncbi:MAG: DUF5107 domain-containing protein [Eubacteriales bacterium]|nr:DUF5107 domain-containing protein [Eubacteriales bacterium]
MDRKGVAIWEEDVLIPTYPIGEPNKNPMFLEKRVYQGSSGKVYPHPVIDKIYDEKEERIYHAVYLENEYLKIMVLPELGGRIQRATDKTNGFDFVYYNHVIKPALVGLAGPWISGGIEFNWPQHHRPSTYDPVSYCLSENEDGSATVFVGEVENMFRTKGMAAFTLYPGKAYLEIRGQLYNRTNVPQTFLWWANPAVAVNEHTQSVFPPDVNAVMDHGKRAVSRFPIATGTYYKMDYSAGVDISRYKNIPVPTSYMAYHSDYNFVGGYDYQKEAGILHVADHHIAPGKKQWTWGCGEFGQAWDRNLTDEDGPYVELMTGCFTDNQPDFSWMEPYEEKVFTQYFMPYKAVGMVKNATIDASLGLEVKDNVAEIIVYATEKQENARITVAVKGEKAAEVQALISPVNIYKDKIVLPEGTKEWEVKVTVTSEEGKELVSYQPRKPEIERIPDPAKEVPLPCDAKTTEDLYLYGKHLEQYRHATYEPADYYLEGLKRDDSDIRLNNAYGSLLFRRGCIAESEPYFRKAIEKQTRSNPNPEDGEALYNLGLTLKLLGRIPEAYDAFYKATWNGAWQDAGFYQLACIDCIWGDYKTALEHIESSIVRNYHNIKARNLKSAILRKLGKTDKAVQWSKATLEIDILDLNSRNELFLAGASGKDYHKEAERILDGNFNTSLELAIDYMEAGMMKEAEEILLSACALSEADTYPLVYYYLAFCKEVQGEEAASWIRKGETAQRGRCFPHRLEDIIILEKVQKLDENTPMAAYYLGNLRYDKKQYRAAVENWEKTVRLDPEFPTAHRNLALAYYNKAEDKERARRELETAYHLDETDARVLMELDQMYKKLGVAPQERLEFLSGHMEQVEDRDDLCVEYITLLNTVGRYQEALDMTQGRRFHPWEGGEGKIPKQYITSLVALGRKAIEAGEYEKAASLLEKAAGSYPWNLGEGKLYGAQENNIYYYLGIAYEKAGLSEKAKECFEKASTGISEPVGAMYYNDQPPEMIYFQGAALKKLGRTEEANSRFHKLLSYGEEHIFDEMRIDYFAVSLPDLMIFDEDLNVKNQIHCMFMMALGYLGLGEKAKAEEYFSEILAYDKSHQGALMIPAGIME